MTMNPEELAQQIRAWGEQSQWAAVTHMLEAARDQFLNYERQHRAKGTVEGDEKARVNALYAEGCDLALAVMPETRT